jgi:hypothetical protein
MPGGKPAGVRCVQLVDDMRCMLFGHPGRPARLRRPAACRRYVRRSREHAMVWLADLERATATA